MTDREAVYLGALLHDVGKFHFRAQEVKASEDHETLGEYFIREHLGKCKALDGNIETVIKASKREAGKIWLADCIAASERESQESKETRRLLLSVFSQVDICKSAVPGKAESKQIFYLEPKPLSQDVQIPQNVAEDAENWKFDKKKAIELHKKELDSFHKEIESLRDVEDTQAFLRSFFSLMEKYTVNICSAGYKSLPDISLFDHSRITAALAVCLEETDEEKEVLVIKGDVSGIQSFIYHDIKMTESAAKQLRGRSFFISLLTDTISNYILQELNLFEANLFFNGGGHCIILAPNNKKNREKLAEVERHTNLALFEKFNGKLGLVLAATEAKAKDVMQDFETVYTELDNELAKAKQHKYMSILDEIMLNPIESKKAGGISIFEDIGDWLPKSEYLIEIIADKRPQNAERIISLTEFSTYYILSDEKSLERDLGNLQNQSIRLVTVWSFKSTDFLKNEHLVKKCKFPLAFGIKFIGSSIPQNKDGQPLDFDKIAAIDTNESPLLGIARMDVDSLGAVFAYGLRTEDEKSKMYSISRLASLSRGLTHFFCGHLNTIAQKHNVYLVYSGGDDVFAVGSWIKILDFAQEVREEFRKYVCGNDNLSISCGIVFTKPTFPIAASAEMAGVQEKAAKDWRPDRKDAVSVFYRETSWKELDALLNLGKNLDYCINRENGRLMPRSLIHTLLTTTQSCFDDKKTIIKPGKVARVAYLFARHEAYSQAIENEQDDIEKLTQENMPEHKKRISILLAKYMLDTDKTKRIQRWKNFTIPASYVLLKTRSSKS